jgi:Protein of unknown function (DUF4238)
MANDHFVAQTYLRHWCRPKTKMLSGYSKVMDKQFPCHPEDVCREWDWDINPSFKDNPALLADFRKMFEPHWRPSIHALRAGALSNKDKFALAGYWAQLTTCTPAWHRNVVELCEHHLLDFIPALAEAAAQRFPEDRDLIKQALAEGKIAPNIDQNYVKAILTQYLTSTIVVLYNQDWTILKNSTDISFITSDNPSSVFSHRPIAAKLTRFLPLAPDLAVITTIDYLRVQQGLAAPDLSKPPLGAIRHGWIDRKRVMQLNRVVVMNADQHVFSLAEERRVRRLVRNHRNFGLAVGRVEIPMPGGNIVGSWPTVRQKRRR